MILELQTDTLDIRLGGAVTTSQLEIIAFYNDVNSNSKDRARQITQSNNTTWVDICSAPPENNKRFIQGIYIFNSDTANATIEIAFDDNAVKHTMKIVTLLPNETLQYTPKNGWEII